MARQWLHINNFSGGMNNVSDPRDLDESEFMSTKDWISDRGGVIRTVGAWGNHDKIGANELSTDTSSFTEGQGFFTFNTDYRIDTDAASPRKYFVVEDDNSGNGKKISFTGVPYGSDTEDSKYNIQIFSENASPMFYYVNSALRIYDNSLNATKTYWMGYIKNLIFPALSGIETSWISAVNGTPTGWYISQQECFPPKATLTNGDHISTLTNSTANTSTDSLINGDDDGSAADEEVENKVVDCVDNTNAKSNPTSSPVGLYYTITAGGPNSTDFPAENVGWKVGTYYNFFATYVYDDNQESLPTYLGQRRLSDDTSNGSDMAVTFYPFCAEMWTRLNPATGNTDSMALNEALDGSETAVDITNGSGLDTGDYIKSGTEVMYVESFGSNTAQVKRGVLGTSAASHSDAAALYRLQINLRVTSIRIYVTTDALPSKYNFVGESRLDVGGAAGPAGTTVKCSAIVSNEYPEGEDYFITSQGIELGDFNTTTFTFSKCNSIYQLYKTSTTLGSETYIGNIKDDNGVLHRDRMIRSLPNKPDIFPETNIVEATTNDGDEVTILANFNDMILMFKETNLYVINANVTGTTGEFLEDSYVGLGVSVPASIFVTTYGVAWANNSGCYLWDGSLTELTESIRVEGDSGYYTASSNVNYTYQAPYWQEFIDKGSEKPLVSYSVRDKVLIVTCSTGNSAHTIDGSSKPISGDQFLFDFNTQSWTFNQRSSTDYIKTNCVTDYRDSACIIRNYHLEQWDNDSEGNTTSSAYLVTKDFDFGNPYVKKIMHTLWITAKVSAAGATNDIKYINDGRGNGSLVNLGEFSQSNSSGTEYSVYKITPSEPIEFSTIRFAIGNTNASVMHINDMAIEYREKHKRTS